MTLKLKIPFVVIFILTSLVNTHGQMNPKYIAQVGGIDSGKMTRGLFLAQQGVKGLRKLTQSHWEPITVDSFDLIILRATIVVVQHKNQGNFFDANLRKAMTALETNDLVLIFNIYARDYGDKVVKLPPLEYKIE